ncbi:MAG: hypothetical protein ACOYI8_01445 [Christensenellales bacterium]|jgi:hypothetical protein
MIQVIMGKKGSGKTKRLIDMANDALKTEHGVVVFIDDDKRYMYDLRHEIRFVDASEYARGEHRSADWFYGLIGGMVSTNFDITVIFVDAFMRLINAENERLDLLFQQLNDFSDAHNIRFVLSVSGDPAELPESVRQYAI